METNFQTTSKTTSPQHRFVIQQYGTESAGGSLASAFHTGASQTPQQIKQNRIRFHIHSALLSVQQNRNFHQTSSFPACISFTARFTSTRHRCLR